MAHPLRTYEPLRTDEPLRTHEPPRTDEPLRTHEDYQIGIICALATEKAAMVAMLDEPHPKLKKGDGDENEYTLGRIGVHNVVIACLPAGLMGNNRAAIVANNMQRSFPIKLGLMVGVGGGVWSKKNDIRLGDIAVSQPTGSHGGVVQWDFGKTGKGGRFHRTGSLDKPPQVLLHALQELRVFDLTDGIDIGGSLSFMVQNKPRMGQTYRYQGADHDQLFEATYDHKGDETCDGCDPKLIVQRPAREDSTPRIHYGIIASGNEVIKHGTTRDKISKEIAKEEGVVCFEMEAAGLIDNFRCLVIRGICDYADSHKNKIWQPYAAATASAFARVLLGFIDEQEVIKTPQELHTINIEDSVKKRRLDEEHPSSDDRRKKFCGYEEADESSGSSNGRTTQSISHGQGIQQTGGKFSVGRDLKFVTVCATPHNDPMDDLCEEFLGDVGEGDPDTHMANIKRDKGDCLEGCFAWILHNVQLKDWQGKQDTRLLWIKGDPGKGKTMLMIGLVEELRDRLRTYQSCALSFFFCRNAEQRLNNGVSVLRGLIWKLLSENPAMGCHIPKAYRLTTKDKRKAMFEESNSYLFDTLKSMLSDILMDANFDTVYLLVDALDECDKDIDGLVEWIAHNAADPGSKAKWLVSGRSTMKLDRALRPKQHQDKLILELNDEHISRAVARFIEQKVDDLVTDGGYSEDLRIKVQKTLEKKAESTFLWAALVCKQLKGAPELTIMTELDEFPLGLLPLYKRMMELIEKQGNYISELCKKILRAVTIAYNPLTLDEIVPMAELHKKSIRNIRELVTLCGSYVILRGETIHFVHLSAKEYLNGDATFFPGGREEEHGRVLQRSLHAMTNILKKDVYDLRHPGFPIDEARTPDNDPLAAVRYSCAYWVHHLSEADRDSPQFQSNISDEGNVHSFLRSSLLYWFEALSLMRNISDSVLALRRLKELLETLAKKSQLLDLVRDAERFILRNRWVMENAPLQAYASALVFSPVNSLTRALFKEEEPKWITTNPAVEGNWSHCLQTLEGHSNSINSVAFSHGSKQLASASSDKTVKIWDTSTGSLRQTLEGHSASINSVAFSHNLKQLASASRDKTIKIWDASTGSLRQTLEGHSEWISSVAFSHDSKLLASASGDKTIKIWDTSSSSLQQTLEGHSASINSVAFSHNSKQLASASRDKTIKIWDASTGSLRQTLEGHSEWINSVAFSSDSKLLASASGDKTIKIWDTSCGSLRHTLEGHSASISSVAFSHDSKLLASASSDKTVKIWDASTGSLQQTLEGHREEINSVTFSHDSKLLASASYDKTIKIWDASCGSLQQTLKDHSEWINSVAFSHDSKLLASASGDKIIKIWDTSCGSLRHTLEGHSEWIRTIVFSHDSKLLASASGDKTVKIWDTSCGSLRQTLEGHSQSINSVAFSHDSKLLASASNDKTVKIWDTSTSSLRQTLEGHSQWINSVAFSHDSKLLASASYDKTIKIWDTSAGFCHQTVTANTYVAKVSFDNIDSNLLMNAGSIKVDGTGLLARSDHPQEGRDKGDHHGLGIGRSWVTWNTQNLLWLPPEYRAEQYNISRSRSIVASGCASGKVVIIGFSLATLTQHFGELLFLTKQH